MESAYQEFKPVKNQEQQGCNLRLVLESLPIWLGEDSLGDKPQA